MGKKSRLPDRSADIVNVSAKWAIFGKQNWRCGMNQTPS